ncbi:phosphonate C-P lyase system protein PhnH [Sneathiella sp.]|jgi:alpha-D-ribose 1-methylphosphonate 5-triphosphate synthase subunit PhnH|uniref:phosphonate C-P lyase system protein PhnH n=1 Tax=Sneathiella sp. TaxID=1964365 RepID=UPI0039E60FFC
MGFDTVSAPLPGLENKAFSSNRIFRDVLEALSRPGIVVTAPENLECPAPINRSATGVLLALADMDTPVWFSPDIRNQQIEQHFQFHTGCPLTKQASEASFAVTHASSDLSFLKSLNTGTPENPHLSATLIVMVDGFNGSTPLSLSGPGIQTKHQLSLHPHPQALIQWAQTNQRLFPCGVDVIFASDTSLAALPRSTQIEVK